MWGKGERNIFLMLCYNLAFVLLNANFFSCLGVGIESSFDMPDSFVYRQICTVFINILKILFWQEVFHERVKCYRNWKDAEVMLARKRENKARLEMAHKTDKVPQAQQEITEVVFFFLSLLSSDPVNWLNHF